MKKEMDREENSEQLLKEIQNLLLTFNKLCLNNFL